MDPEHPYYDIIVKDPRYAEEPKPEEFPMFESLKLTIERTLPYWNNVIVPEIKSGKKILIAAHGNSLRGIVKHLDNMSEEAIMELNLPTGQNLFRIKWKKKLGRLSAFEIKGKQKIEVEL